MLSRVVDALAINQSESFPRRMNCPSNRYNTQAKEHWTWREALTILLHPKEPIAEDWEGLDVIETQLIPFQIIRSSFSSVRFIYLNATEEYV